MLTINQVDVHSLDDYPAPYESDWMDSGSRTMDNGMRFTIEVDYDGFHVREESGVWTVSDLFSERGFWPTELVWGGQNPTLLGLLEDLAPAARVTGDEMMEIVRNFIENYDPDHLGAYLLDEQSGSLSPEELRTKYAEMRSIQIPGLPSERFEPGSRYRGLELEYGSEGWKATLREPDPSDELFHPEDWKANTLDDAIANLPFTREEIVNLLADADPRWLLFVDVDFSVPAEVSPADPPNFTRLTSSCDWEIEELVTLKNANGDEIEDTAILGRRPTASGEGEFYLYVESEPETVVRTNVHGYPPKKFHEMKRSLIKRLAKKGLDL
jgi:hypothetical protein